MSAALDAGTPAAFSDPARAPAPGRRGAGRRIAWPPLLALGLFGVVLVLLLSPGRREAPATVLRARDLVATTAADGTVALDDAATGRRVALLPGDRDSFVRGVLHGTGRIRGLRGVDPRAPYRLEALSNGRLVLLDPATGVPVELEAFGPDNAASFAALLGAPPSGTQEAGVQPAGARPAGEAR